MNEIKLKPCPFCGGEAELHNYVNNYVPHSSVACVRCRECRSATDHFTDRAGRFEYMFKAIEAWNGRTDNG